MNLCNGRLWIGCLGVCLTITGIAAAQDSLWTRSRGVDWPGFLGPAGNATSPETGVPKSLPPQGPQVRWHVTTGTGYGSASVSGGRCFFFDRVDGTARLRCFAAETGELQWDYTYPSLYKDMYGFDNGPRSSPVVDGDRVYIYGAEGELHCVNIANGQRVWMMDVNDEFGVIQNFFGVGSTPIIHEQLLIFTAGGSPPEEDNVPLGQLDRVSANGTAIVAVDKKSGDVVYRVGKDLASYASLRVARFHQQATIVAFLRGGLMLVDARSGKELAQFDWRAKKLESVNAANPVIHGNRIFITESYEKGGCLLEVTEDRSLRVVWQDRRRQQSIASHWMTPVYHAGYLYGVSGESSGNAVLRCVDWETGAVQWSQSGLTRATLLLVDDLLVCQSEDGVMRFIEPTAEKYTPLAEFRLVAGDADSEVAPGSPLLKRPVWAAPVLSHGLLFVRGDGRLVCAELIPDKS